VIEAYLGARVIGLELLGRSSNRVYRARLADGRCVVVKVPRVTGSRLTPFWHQLRDVFAVDLAEVPEHLSATVQSLAPALEAGISVPDCTIVRGPNGPMTIASCVPGTAWEPDRFPESVAVNYQVGDLVGRLHARGAEGYGPVWARHRSPLTTFYDAAVRYLRGARGLEAVIERTDPADVASRSAVIMADISANQFLYDGGRVSAVVDLDAYVVGPVELELAMLECCISVPAAFRRGYERHLPLPRFARFRDFYRLWMGVVDIDGSMSGCSALFD
jgi:Ser/Thr protein kinase RdoA (MazF antagonist)